MRVDPSAGAARRAVTLADVARRASVSVGTVSKALNGRGQLRPETRDRVVEAARELGFRPNQLARGLISGRSFIVGVVSTDSYGRFTLPILTGAEDALGPGKISIMLCESRGDPIRENHYLDTLIGQRVDGIIITGRSSDPRPSLTRAVPVPVVYALSPSDSDEDVSVVPDDVAGARRAVEHLLAGGRRSVVVVAGPQHQAASRHRVEGAAQALEAAGLAPAHEPLYGEWSERWGHEAVGRLLSAGADIDGLLCANDQIARGALERLRDAGVAVPSAVGVVGVDNWNVVTDAARPSLTSVDLNLRTVGRQAASLLLQAIDGDRPAPGIRQVECTLRTRESS